MNPRSRNLLVVAAIAVVVLFVVAIALAGGGDDEGGDDGGAAVSQFRAVDVAGSLPPFESGAADAAAGQPAPTVTGHSFDGEPVHITPDDGRPKLLVFLAHWCPHCQAEVPVLTAWIDGGGADGVDVYAISTSASEDRPNWPPSSWLDREGWPAPVLVDDEQSSAAAAFGLTAFPYFVLVDGDGTVVARGTGELSSEQLTQLADQAR